MKSFKLHKKPKEKRLLLNTIKENPKDFLKLTYRVMAYFIGSVVFIGVWIYAIVSWGFLIGIAIGWVPALIAGAIAGFLWPLAILIALILAILIFG